MAANFEWEKPFRDRLVSHKLKGKAEEAYINLPVNLSQNYEASKEVVLNKYERVPESYGQQFRHSVKSDNQTWVLFFPDLMYSLDKSAAKISKCFNHAGNKK